MIEIKYLLEQTRKVETSYAAADTIAFLNK